MTNTKPWYASKGVWGGLIATGATLLNAFGIEVTPEDQNTLISGVTQMVAVGGAVVAVFGRIVANSRIG